MKKNTFAILFILELIGCASAHRVPPIFTDDNISDIKPYKCVDCGINPFTWFQRLSEAPIQQINPYEYGKVCSDAAKTQCTLSFYQIASRPSSDGIKCSKAGGVGITSREEARNNLMSAAMRLADASTSEHLSAIKATEVNMNLILGAATAGLTGGASVASSAASAQVLSAAATGTNAGRSLFSETTYRDALGETLVSSIETSRDSERVQLVAKMHWCIDDYPVELALADVQKYLEAGSFYHGLALIRQAAEQKNTDVSKQTDKQEIQLAARSDNFFAEATQQRVDSLLDKINALDPVKAKDLASNPPVNDAEADKVIKLRDPGNHAKSDPKVAKEMLKMRVTLGKREPADLDSWEAALVAAQ